jgi:short-subunit dehydrogenase
MSRSLILANTRGLGRHLVRESLARGFPSTLMGRHDGDAVKDPSLAGMLYRAADLADPYALPRTLCACCEKVTHLFWVATPFRSSALAETKIEDARYIMEEGVIGLAGALAAFHRMMKMARALGDAPGAPYHLVVIVSAAVLEHKDGAAVPAAAHAAALHLARGFAPELAADLPGSKTTAVSVPDAPDEESRDALARRIWSAALAQTETFGIVSLGAADPPAAAAT